MPMPLPASPQMRLLPGPGLKGEMDEVGYGFMDLGREGQTAGNGPLPSSPRPLSAPH